MKRRTAAQLRLASYSAPLAPGMCGREPPLPPKPKVEPPPSNGPQIFGCEQKVLDALRVIAENGGELPLAPDFIKLLSMNKGTFYAARCALRDLDLIDFRSGHGSNAHGPAPWMVRIVATGVVLRSANCPVTWTVEGGG